MLSIIKYLLIIRRENKEIGEVISSKLVEKNTVQKKIYWNNKLKESKKKKNIAINKIKEILKNKPKIYKMIESRVKI
jgi:hypothetical protein